MPHYPQFATDYESARTAYLKDPRFAAAYDEPYLKNITLALDELEVAGLVTPPNRAALTARTLNNYHFAEDFKKLRQTGILCQPLFDALILHIEQSARLTEGFLILHQEGILIENLTFLVKAPQFAPRLALGLAALNQAQISNPARSRLLLEFPQLLPSVLLLNQNKILDRTKLEALAANLSFINGLTAVFTELNLAGFLNKDTYTEALKIVPQAENFNAALRELRQTGRLKENFTALVQKSEYSANLASGMFNFNYGETPLTQEDLDLLFKFAPQAEPLSLIMIALSHQDLLNTYRFTLTEQGQHAASLLKLSDKLKQTHLFNPTNIASVFRNIHRVDKILQACEEQKPLSQEVFNKLMGKLQAERRIRLHLGSTDLGASSSNISFFSTRSKPTPEQTKPNSDLPFKLG